MKEEIFRSFKKCRTVIWIETINLYNYMAFNKGQSRSLDQKLCMWKSECHNLAGAEEIFIREI